MLRQSACPFQGASSFKETSIEKRTEVDLECGPLPPRRVYPVLQECCTKYNRTHYVQFCLLNALARHGLACTSREVPMISQKLSFWRRGIRYRNCGWVGARSIIADHCATVPCRPSLEQGALVAAATSQSYRCKASETVVLTW